MRWGDRGSIVVKVLCYKSEGRWFDPSWCQWNFHWHKILPIALWPWGRHSLWQKLIPWVSPGGKGSRCVRLTTLPPCCAVVMKSGNLNFLEPSGPLRVCNGTALPLLDVVGGQRHSLAALTPGMTRYHCTGGWVRNTAGLDVCGKSRPHLDSISGTSRP